MAQSTQDRTLRTSVCFGLPHVEDVALPGETRFPDILETHYNTQEAIVQEKVIALKERAREANSEDFWEVIAAGLSDVFGSQSVFLSTRVTHDRTTGKALPQLGEVGSYLNALALYFNDGKTIKGLEREVLYKAWDCPCSGMKYGKVFIIPHDAEKFTPENPNKAHLPFTLDAYIGMPCFTKGVNVGHFGMVWSHEGSAQRKLSWGFIEAMLHIFEDLILTRIMRHIEADSLSHWRSLPAEKGENGEIATINSFKPHAHILSHELRTPMQGVVGMLDLVQATVQEALASTRKINSGEVLAGLKDDITAIQDSSKRAVEATENIIEAYKLDMGMPLRATITTNAETIIDVPTRIHAGPKARRLSIAPADDEPPTRGVKRKFENGETRRLDTKPVRILSNPLASPTDRRNDIQSAVTETARLFGGRDDASEVGSEDAFTMMQRQSEEAFAAAESAGNGLQYCKMADLMGYIVNETFNVGGRPESVSHEDRANGQIVHARYKKTDGTREYKVIQWQISEVVPDTILVNERDLAKLVSCVYQNAVKFTRDATINLDVNLDESGRLVIVNVRDNGPGIRPEFRPKIFQPFTKEDSSITRRTEGLGLGLLVAKGLAGKLGGDLNLVRSETEGEHHGSEFEIRFPVFPTGISTPQTAPSAPPSVYGSTAGRNRRRSSASSQVLRSIAPPPFGTSLGASLSQDQITPAASTEISPKLGVIHEAMAKAEITLETPPGESLTILVVEDNHINRRLLVNMLTKLGHDRSRILEAYDGAEAVRQVTEVHARHAEDLRVYGQSTTAPIDLVLMDIWMPNVDGYEATEKILALYGPVRKGMRRCISEPGNVPMANGNAVPHAATATATFMVPPTILAVTADATDDASARAAQVGMDGFIAKPFKLRDLEKLVKEAEKKRIKRRELAAA